MDSCRRAGHLASGQRRPRLQAGSVWINNYCNLSGGSPFGGFKESGIGSEFCHETLNMYTHLKAVTVQTKVNAPWFAPKP